MEVTLLGIVIVANEEQFLKALALIEVTLEGVENVTVLRLRQSLNALSNIVITLVFTFNT